MIKTTKEAAVLTPADLSLGTQFMVKIDNVLNNPLRDFDIYPIISSKVKTIMESAESTMVDAGVKESGAWRNITARFFGNATPVLADLTFDQLGICTNMKVEIDAGHHRLEAFRKAGHKYVVVTVMNIDGDNMYRRMAAENYDTFNAYALAKVETVRQGVGILSERIDAFENFEDYKAAGHMLPDNAKGFANAKSQGIGRGLVHKFLGKPWILSEIGFALKISNDLTSGLLKTTDINNLSSIRQIESLGGLVADIQAKDWPQVYKDRISGDCIKQTNSKSSNVTVQRLKDAREVLKTDVNPAKNLASGSPLVFSILEEVTKDLKAYEASMPEGEVFQPEVCVTELHLEGYEKILGAAYVALHPAPAEEGGAEGEEGAPVSTDDEAGLADVDVSVDAPTEAELTELGADVGIDIAAGTAADEAVKATNDYFEIVNQVDTLAIRLNVFKVDLFNEGNAPALKATTRAIAALSALMAKVDVEGALKALED